MSLKTIERLRGVTTAFFTIVVVFFTVFTGSCIIAGGMDTICKILSVSLSKLFKTSFILTVLLCVLWVVIEYILDRLYTKNLGNLIEEEKESKIVKFRRLQ